MIQQIMMVTVAITVAVMVLCFATDIRERMIYAFPCIALTSIWVVLGVISTRQFLLIGAVLTVHLVIYLTFKITGAWGDGDSDVFLLYGMIFMMMILTGGHEIGIMMYLIVELAGLVIALLISFVVAVIEAKFKGQKLTRQSSIAVVPGFSIVIILMVTKMVFWR